MSIKNRYDRAMSWLETMMEQEPDHMKFAIKTDMPNLRVLRNEVELWKDYKENPDYILGGVNHDPNHPDNLSSIVWNDFKRKYQ